jgi:hypothetical protein
LGQLLASLFSPYASKSADGSVRISNPSMADLHSELIDELGTGANQLAGGRN